jgi:CDP-glucose 4,6-dehydratase
VKIPAPVTSEGDFWAGRRVLVTGHTGFKGAWLSLWLQALGARVSGLAAGVPTRPSLYELAAVGEHMEEVEGDLRDPRAVAGALAECAPEIVFHLAAQPLVRRSLRDPRGTYEVNVMGVVNLLEAVRGCRSVRAVVLVTSDRCYARPAGVARRFREDDPLGGADPYSSSKACAELVVAAYRSSFLSAEGAPRLASARTGNVIGGGDWGQERLLADAVRAVAGGTPLRVHNPAAVRPWQHVLGPLAGYLLLARRLCEDAGAARAWNFGPPPADERTVGWVVERLGALWEGELRWELGEAVPEADGTHLAIDSGAAEADLGWRPACGLEEALELAVAWHRAERSGTDMRASSLAQIDRLATAATV